MTENVSKFASRLPEHIVPEFYRIYLDVDGSHKSYNGNVEIDLKISKKTKIIILHGAELSIIGATVSQSKNSIPVVSIDQNKDLNFITISLGSELEIGSALLKIDFKNTIGKSMRGFYLTTYQDDENNTHEGLVTNFEPDDASRAIPCFDEPNFKSVFQVSIKYLKNKTVLSNSPLKSRQDHNDGFETSLFEETPKMSTYLLAFAMGDFKCLSKVNNAGVKYSVYSPVNKVKFCSKALDACEKFINFYTDFFGIAYPLNKLDLIAIPDISVGAMENWGLITFREDLLLIDPDNTSNHTIKNVYLVIAHEIAHQWFGNLVTMKWWTDLWLNEGFANWIEYLAVDACFPEINIWKSFHVSNYASAMELDSYIASHAIEVEDTHPSELDEIFDHITYCKGASIINMMYNFTGHDNFRKGLSNYMHKYKYSNVITLDLWSCLEDASKNPISEFMGSFTKQVGYPVLEVISDPNDPNSISLCQRRFLLQNKSSDLKWVIPVTLSIFGDTIKKSQWILKEKTGDKIKLENKSKYYLLNHGRHGFYRVLYPRDNLNQILKHYSELSLADKFGLVSDYYAFARGRYVGTSCYLDIVSRISSLMEKEEEIWEIVAKSLNDIYSLMYYSKHPQCLDLIKKYCVKIMLPLLESFKVSSDNLVDKSPMTIKLVSILMSCLSKYHDGTRNMLLGWFDDFTKGKISVLPDFRICMYRSCFASKEYTKKALEYFDTLKMTEEKVDVVMGMTGAVDKEVIAQLYDFAMQSTVKPQDARFIFSALSQSPFAHDIGWDYVTKHSKEIKEKFAVPFIVNRIFGNTVSGFASLDKHQKCLDYFKTCEDVKMNQFFEQSLESISIRAQWLEKDQDEIFNWFQKVVG